MNSSKAVSQQADPDGARRNLASITPFFIVKDLQASIGHGCHGMLTPLAPAGAAGRAAGSTSSGVGSGRLRHAMRRNMVDAVD